MVKRYLSFALALLVLFFFATLSKVLPDEYKKDQQENEKISPKYSNFAGPKDIKLKPVDEAEENASFARFREELLASVKRRDAEFLKEHIYEKIKYSFGKNDGKKGFLQEWGLDTNPDESEVWDELRAVLTLGGTFNDEKTIFTAPYIYTEFPERIDAFQHIVIIDKNVKVYSKADLDAKIIGELDYSIVKMPDPNIDSTDGWLEIENFSGDAGFLQAKYARSPIDFRARFQKVDGVWKMMFFIAGD